MNLKIIKPFEYHSLLQYEILGERQEKIIIKLYCIWMWEIQLVYLHLAILFLFWLL